MNDYESVSDGSRTVKVCYSTVSTSMMHKISNMSCNPRLSVFVSFDMPIIKLCTFEPGLVGRQGNQHGIGFGKDGGIKVEFTSKFPS